MGTAAIGENGQQIYRADKLAYGLGDSYVTTTVAGKKFILQTMGIGEEGEMKTYRDNTGVTCSIVVPETYQTLNLSGLLVAGSGGGATTLKKGDEVTGLPQREGMRSGVHWRVESFSTEWSNEDVSKVSLTVRSYTF